VARRRLGQKRHGVLPFVVRGAHPLMRGTARRIAVPHSRWNDLDEAALAAAGYQVLAASSRGGVDRFVHDDAPGCVFLQGHPEYESASLALEYRRDVRRYLTGESPRYPTMPYGCFDAPTRSRMVALQRAVRHQRDVTVLEAFPVPMHQAAPWRDGAVRLYRNWLDAMALAQRLAVADA
jgi:homoserine O-succinyltransferase